HRPCAFARAPDSIRRDAGGCRHRWPPASHRPRAPPYRGPTGSIHGPSRPCGGRRHRTQRRPGRAAALAERTVMSNVRVLRGTAHIGMHLEPATIVIEGDRIAAIQRGIESTGNYAENVRIEDVDVVSPGLIDLQVNGGNGAEIGNSANAIDHVSAWLPSTGVSAWLPTVVTAPADFYPGVFEAWAQVDPGRGAVPLGYHLE